MIAIMPEKFEVHERPISSSSMPAPGSQLSQPSSWNCTLKGM